MELAPHESMPLSRRGDCIPGGAGWPPGLGCTYLQLDDPSFAAFGDREGRVMLERHGRGASQLVLRNISHINAALVDRPAGMAVTTPICRGNFRSSRRNQGSYDDVAEPLFSELAVDGFLLEYNDECADGFEPLRFVSKGKAVVLGLVTSKRPVPESHDDLKRASTSPECSWTSASVAYSQTAVSLPRWTATISSATTSSPSSAWSSSRRRMSGARPWPSGDRSFAAMVRRRPVAELCQSPRVQAGRCSSTLRGPATGAKPLQVFDNGRLFPCQPCRDERPPVGQNER